MTSKATAECISLLYLLHDVPSPPSLNTVSKKSAHRSGYTLPFEREQRLTSTLAFLTSNKDAPNHVPAACIEECASSTQLDVLVAVNKKGPMDGNGTLQNIKRDLETVFRVLSRIPDGESEVYRDVTKLME